MTTTQENAELEEQLRAITYKAVVSAYNTSQAGLIDYAHELSEELRTLIQSEISKREALLLDELEEAVGNAKYGEDQGFNYAQAVDDVYDFINAKRKT